MKKLIKSLAIIALIASCSSEPDQFIQETSEKMSFQTFLLSQTEETSKQKLALIQSEGDIRNSIIIEIFNRFSGKQLNSIAEIPELEHSTVSDVIESSSNLVPNFENYTEADMDIINVFFPLLSIDQVNLYSDYLKEFFRGHLEYEIYKLHGERNKNVITPQKSSSGTYSGACQSEITYAVTRPLITLILWDAKVDTDTYAGQMFGSNLIDNVDDIGANAVKHAMWNYLISQYVGDHWYYSRKKARKIARELTDLHEECGAYYPNAQSDMDLHNNLVGRDLHELNSTLTTQQLKNELSKRKNLAEMISFDRSQVQQADRARLVYLKSVFNDPTSSNATHTSCSLDSTDPDCPPGSSLYPKLTSEFAYEYLYGDWNGNGTDNPAIRNNIFDVKMSLDLDQTADQTYTMSFAYGQIMDQTLVGDFNGDGVDDIAIRTNNLIRCDFDKNGTSDLFFYFGFGNTEDQYLAGDVNGDGTDDIVVRRGNELLSDTDRNGYVDFQFWFGNGNAEDQYLIGDWNGDGTGDIIVRRGNELLSDTDKNGFVDRQKWFGYGNDEFEYMIGDWNGDGFDDISIRRDFKVISELTGLNSYFEHAFGLGVFPSLN